MNETLNKRADSKRLFDSKNIPAEIIDMVQVSQSSLDKPGGKNFACLVIDIYYSVNRRLADPATRKETVSALAERFAKLDNASMEKVLTDCRFFSTPEAGLALLNGEKVMINTEPDGKTPITQDNFKDIMPRVVKFSVKHKIADKEPTVAFGDKASAPDANFRLDPTYIKAYLEHEKAAPAK